MIVSLFSKLGMLGDSLYNSMRVLIWSIEDLFEKAGGLGSRQNLAPISDIPEGVGSIVEATP
jgi:hypothetical protein